MKETKRLVTADELFEMGDLGRRTELVRGEVRQMAPAGGEHGWVSGNVYGPLHVFVREHRLGQTFIAETGFLIARDPDTVRAPDCSFVRAERLPGRPPKRFIPFAPDLAVETVSPSNARADVEAKVRGWLDAGTSLVWVLEPEARTVTVHRADGSRAVLREEDTLDGEDVVPGFTLAVSGIFE